MHYVKKLGLSLFGTGLLVLGTSSYACNNNMESKNRWMYDVTGVLGILATVTGAVMYDTKRIREKRTHNLGYRQSYK